MESAAKNDAEPAFMRRYQDLYAKINNDARRIREQQSIMDDAGPKSDEDKQANARRLAAQSRMNRNAKDLTKLEKTNLFKSLARAEVERQPSVSERKKTGKRQRSGKFLSGTMSGSCTGRASVWTRPGNAKPV